MQYSKFPQPYWEHNISIIVGKKEKKEKEKRIIPKRESANGMRIPMLKDFQNDIYNKISYLQGKISALF